MSMIEPRRSITVPLDEYDTMARDNQRMAHLLAAVLREAREGKPISQNSGLMRAIVLTMEAVDNPPEPEPVTGPLPFRLRSYYEIMRRRATEERFTIHGIRAIICPALPEREMLVSPGAYMGIKAAISPLAVSSAS